jgi:hypothetical protein
MSIPFYDECVALVNLANILNSNLDAHPYSIELFNVITEYLQYENIRIANIMLDHDEYNLLDPLSEHNYALMEELG